jgi:uncharacterized protein YjbI with pentapeptide repeats
MANDSHLTVLKDGTSVWNEWRKKNIEILPDLSDTNLREMRLSWANLKYANLSNSDLTETNLTMADLTGASLRNAVLTGGNLSGSIFIGADLTNARLDGAYLSNANCKNANFNNANLNNSNLSGANFCHASLVNATLKWANLSSSYFTGANLTNSIMAYADLSWTKFKKANISNANLTCTQLIETDFEEATITGCIVYGISAWGLKLKQTNQFDLLITAPHEPNITVDDLEIAQFIYLLLHSDKVRNIIDNITSKVVLILGRFSPERKIVLDVIRNELRKHNYIPLIFDFEKPTNRDITETITVIASMARFIIADITDARSIPQELEHVVPNFPSVPVLPLIDVSQNEYDMFEHFKKYPWVLDIYRYGDLDGLVKHFVKKIIAPLEIRTVELQKGRSI